MDCFNPICIPHRGTVPCGKCLACLQRKTSDWTFRLLKEYEVSKNTIFVTLTYRESDAPRKTVGETTINVLSKRDVQLFLKRFRKSIEPHRIRYFLCGEYGTRTYRPHYHAIIFNMPYDDIQSNRKLIDSAWQKGFTVTKSVKSTHFMYCAKYCASYTLLPPILRHKSIRPFLLCSRRPAIGSSYLSDRMVRYHRETLTNNVTHAGKKLALPKYYKDRIFDDDMKAQIKDKVDAYRATLPYEGFNGILGEPLYVTRQKDFEENFKRNLIKKSKI